MYLHRNPKNMEIVYVGHGTNERAWRCTSFGKMKDPRYGHRSEEHGAWCQNLIKQGYVPGDWVQVAIRSLSKSAACVEEQKLIRLFKPRFNKVQGKQNLKVNKDIFIEAKRLREKGLSYEGIASDLALSTMTIWRALNGKTKNI